MNQQWLKNHAVDAESVSRGVSRAVSLFLHSLIAGEFGLDDSRDGRSAAFLKYPDVVARCTEVFIEWLLTDRNGKVSNHEETEQHAVDYLHDHIA